MPTEQSTIFDPPAEIKKNAYISSFEQYQELYKQSIENPQGFWCNVARQFHWETAASAENYLSYNFDISKGPIFTKWLEGSTTNICYNLLDRNVKNGNADTVAFYW